ncbi:hypothetical protein DXG01_001561 [Tephrocybe rancida]|nr:hypothetical protein DXG01_001561 [Tephrocybe rancida]
MVSLLEDYVVLLREVESGSQQSQHSDKAYLMPAYTVSPGEWAEFESVYHTHRPKIPTDSATRDLQVSGIMDDNNAEGPVSEKIMSRRHTSVSGLQTFAPTSLASKENAYVPLEVLIDLRCDKAAFDQLVPQTDVIFHYNKFNRLRLRNNVTSVARGSSESGTSARDSHLQNETDLVRVHIPRFTVSASEEHFKAISHVITQLLLFSDAAHKTRLEKLETLLFTYDFTDLASAARVVADLQVRPGEAHDAQKAAEYHHSRRLDEKEGQLLELFRLKAHIFLLAEELNFLFDAIKLAQDRHDDHSDQKFAGRCWTTDGSFSLS